MSERFSAGVVCIDDEGRVLAVTRGDDESNWGLPFGACDPGETPEQTAVREAFEETGLEVYALREIYRAKAFTMTAVCYLAKSRGTLRASEEGRPAWIDLDRLLLPSCTYAEFNRAVVRALVSGGLSQPPTSPE